MHMSNEGLLIIILVGIIAGWLAGKIVDGGGFGLIGDLIVGVVGAFVGDWLLPRLHIHLGVGIIPLIANATIGAIVLLVILRVIFGSRRWGRCQRRSLKSTGLPSPYRRKPRHVALWVYPSGRIDRVAPEG
jgi:uncharacterized membrane protein YeaQ/YmgE (transglycosylase-associated protein family)